MGEKETDFGYQLAVQQAPSLCNLTIVMGHILCTSVLDSTINGAGLWAKIAVSFLNRTQCVILSVENLQCP